MGVAAGAVTAVSSEEEEAEEDPMDGIFASQASVNLQDIPKFHSTDLSAAAAAVLTSSDTQDLEVLSSRSSSEEEEEQELGEFLWDAMAGFDPNLQDLANLCPPN